ncbi:DNA (cytosine-5)-methyltransferase CMT3 [Medicago truncatula]|uniref:DNA (cytosine-5-)-methyltransferase n=1 Tax=Medicago truncatula TaxID=3880 RepID=G7LEN9_MEDTR|nr:DNA (cytosine-5)-methyltransferase CMT3 [Medicago truncatula]
MLTVTAVMMKFQTLNFLEFRFLMSKLNSAGQSGIKSRVRKAEGIIFVKLEMFESVDGELFFRAQWYYRAKDTVSHKDHGQLIDPKRVFYSEVQDDNPLDCLVGKLNIARLELNLGPWSVLFHMVSSSMLPDANLGGLLKLLQLENKDIPSETSSIVSSDIEVNGISELNTNIANTKPELKLLDLYSGCGAMSTGLCQGGILSGSKMVTMSFIYLLAFENNHLNTICFRPCFDMILFEKLCCYFSLTQNMVPHEYYVELFREEEEEEDDNTGPEENNGEEIFEVPKVIDMRYNDPKKEDKHGLYFKVFWKGYDSGVEDVVCGGPPCQGIKKQTTSLFFIHIVHYLRPKFTLMENVVDLLKFSYGFLVRYALGRLVQMSYRSHLIVYPMHILQESHLKTLEDQPHFPLM